VRVGADLTLTPVVSRFEGKRFNSPNDLVFAKDGALYFTDPPYGLARQDDDPAKELAFNGVYRFANGRIQAVVRDLNRPNGLAFSPDGKILYVNNSDPAKNLVMRYDVLSDGSLVNGRVFADITSKVDGVADGMKLDSKGNIYTAGPGGVWVLSPSGKHLGTIAPPETPANCAWGDNGKTLYMTALTSVYRVRTLVGR
jgi:gluconolactonase